MKLSRASSYLFIHLIGLWFSEHPKIQFVFERWPPTSFVNQVNFSVFKKNNSNSSFPLK